MAGVATFDHAGFIVEDLTRAQRFYEKLFGARPLWTSNLHRRTYEGWPIILFLELGYHRFEVCLARHELAPVGAIATLPRLGFSVADETFASLGERLASLGVEHSEPFSYPKSWGIGDCVRIWDPDGNPLDLTKWDGAAPARREESASGEGSGDPPIALTDMSHAALEVTDLDLAEKFYTAALGLEVADRDEGERGTGRVVLRNLTDQVLILEHVEKMSPRSLYCGPDPSTAPPTASVPYAGAHLAMTTSSAEEYGSIEGRVHDFGVFSDGDIRAGQRGPNERSDYFYDPAGNRLQLVFAGSKS